MFNPQNASEIVDDLRSRGWRVAVHNDYMFYGKLHTFWLFTNIEQRRFIKGEAKTDFDALMKCWKASIDKTAITHG